MASALLKLETFAPSPTILTLVDGTTATGYAAMDDIDFGDAVWDLVYAGRRGSQGSRVAYGVPQMRPVKIPWRVVASASQDAHAVKIQSGDQLVEELRRFGGRLTIRHNGQSWRQYAQIMGAQIVTRRAGSRFEQNQVSEWDLNLMCAPYLTGDPMDIFDGFSTDTITSGDWTVDLKTLTPLVQGGQLVPADANTFRIRHTANGYQYGDGQNTVKLTMGASVAGMGYELYQRGAVGGGTFDTYLYASISATTLSIGKRIAGSATSLASTGVVPVAGTTYWMRLRTEGAVAIAEWFTTEPSPMVAPAFTVTYTLTVDEASVLRFGQTGLRGDVNDTAERVDDYRFEAYTYRNLSLPEDWSLVGNIPGDTAALCDVQITPSGSGVGSGDGSLLGGETYPVYAQVGWAKKPPVWNACWNGDFEDDANGWTISVVAGVLANAGTSIARDTTAARNKYGAANGQIVCPATANSGASFTIPERFKKGRRYLAYFWASSAAGVTLARIRLGVSGDIASETPIALSATPTLHSVMWTPTADRDTAYVVAEITAATATTWSIDGVVVCEALQTTLSAAIASAGAVSCTVNSVPGDWEAAPFRALVESEIVWVSAVSGTTLTIVRGQEGTTAATHAISLSITPLPNVGKHYQGEGAWPPFGIVESEGCDLGDLDTPGATKWQGIADAEYRCGVGLQATNMAGAGSTSATWIVDPHLMIGDDYTQGEIDVSVYARFEIDGDVVTPVMTLSAFPVDGVTYGSSRYSNEFGSVGKLVADPGDVNQDFRPVFLGTLRFPVDRTQPGRWKLKVAASWQAGSAGVFGLDYLWVVPSQANVRSPERKPLDATYPKFVQSTSETLRVIRSDRSGLIAKPTKAYSPEAGLGGSPIEIPPGPAAVFVKLSSMVPDDSTSGLTDSEFQSHAATVHFAVTPRYTHIRGS